MFPRRDSRRLPYHGCDESSLGGCHAASAWKQGRACTAAAWHWGISIWDHIQVTLWPFKTIFLTAAFLLVNKSACDLTNPSGVFTCIFWLQNLYEESPKIKWANWHLKRKKKKKQNCWNLGHFDLRNTVLWEFLSNWSTGLIASYCVVVRGTRRMPGIGCSLISDSALGHCATWRLNLIGGFFKANLYTYSHLPISKFSTWYFHFLLLYPGHTVNCWLFPVTCCIWCHV